MNHLYCSSCGRTYEDWGGGGHNRWRCECGHALDFVERPLPDPFGRSEYEIDPREGLWAFDAFVPVEQRVSLGEGFTPLVDAPWDCQFKLEYVSPTGSFKDRGATTVLSYAVEVGPKHIVEDSSGNAGSAIATYAARAGLDCTIYVPASVKPAKVRAIERVGAEIVRVEGSRESVTEACIDTVESGAGWYASHAWNPAFFEGTATMAYELVYQRGCVPDVVVMPLGHGTLFLGAYRGFRALVDAGWVDEMPRLLGVQSAGYDPIASELHGRPMEKNSNKNGNADADGIQIREPARKDQLLDAIEESGGDCIALGGEAVENTLDALHSHGFYVEPTSAIAPAALKVYREQGIIDRDEDVVVPLTGSGMKT
jgi:threonine synthase